MLTLLTTEAEHRVEEWRRADVLRRVTPGPGQRLMHEMGFQLEVSEIREEVEAQYGPTEEHWVIARRLEDRGSSWLGAPPHP
jgi:hypothetical protein